MLNYTILIEEENIIFKLNGSFVVGEIKDFFQKIQKGINNFKVVIFDFSNVNFIDSYGIGQLVHFYKNLKTKGISLKICSLDKSLKDIFDKLRVSIFFDIYETCEEALTFNDL